MPLGAILRAHVVMKHRSHDVGNEAIAELGDLLQIGGVSLEPGDEWGPGPSMLKVLLGSWGSPECLERGNAEEGDPGTPESQDRISRG